MLALAACSSREAPAPPPPDPGAVHVERVGVDPHPLRYALAKGTKTPFQLEMDAELHAGAMGGVVPTFVISLELSVDDVRPDGSMNVRTTIVDATVRDRPGAQVPATSLALPLSQLKGIAIVGTLSPTGKLSGARIDSGDKPPPADVADQLKSLTNSIEQIAMPLPVEPVGCGARWTSERDLDFESMTMTSKSTVDLIVASDHALGFQATTELSGPDQQVQRGGLAIDVTNVHGTGSGLGTLDLSTLAMMARFDASYHSDMTAAGEKTPMDMKMSVRMTPP